MKPFTTVILKQLVFKLGGIIAIAVILALFLVAYNSTYDTVVTLDREAGEGWNRVTHDLVERYRGIPAFAAALRPSLGPDTPVLDDLERNLSRWNAALRDSRIEELNPETANLEAAISRLATVLEGRPEIRQSLEVVLFLDGLRYSGGVIGEDRAAFNQAVREYNEVIGTFPATLWTGNWGYGRREPFTAEIWEGDRPPAAGQA